NEIDVAFKIGRFRVQVLHHPLDLSIKGFHRMRQKTLEAVFAALFGRERRALVENWVVQQRNAMQGGIVGLNFISLGHCLSLCYCVPMFQWADFQLLARTRRTGFIRLSPDDSPIAAETAPIARL